MRTAVNKIKIQGVNRRVDRFSHFFSPSGVNNEFLANNRDLGCSPRSVVKLGVIFWAVKSLPEKRGSQAIFPTPYKSITRLVPHYRTRQCGFFSYLCDRGRGDVFFRCSDQCILELNPVLPAVVSAPFLQWSQCPTTECLSLYWVWTLQSWHILPFQCYLPALADVHTPSDLLSLWGYKTGLYTAIPSWISMIMVNPH